MFKIVLRPDEQVVLQLIKVGLCPPGLPDQPLVLRIIALGMLQNDEHGNPKLTPLGEAALARVMRGIHWPCSRIGPRYRAGRATPLLLTTISRFPFFLPPAQH